jgi:hypothetical protein
MCQTACPNISETVIPILGVSKCLETLKYELFTGKRENRERKEFMLICERKRKVFLVSLKNYIQKHTFNSIYNILLITYIIRSKYMFQI